MTAISLRTWSYRLSAVLGSLYVGYVLVQKFRQAVNGGPLGEVGEFLLVLACITAFAIGLFADESSRQPPRP